MPPVSDSKNLIFCFEARAWHSVITTSVELTKVCHVYKLNANHKKVFRQADPKFVTLLNEIRHGIINQSSIEAIAATRNSIPLLAIQVQMILTVTDVLEIKSQDGHDIVATRLEPYRNDGMYVPGQLFSLFSPAF